MKLTDDVYLVGSGNIGVRLTHPSDCHVYLFDLHDGTYALVDAGVGIETDRIVNNIKADGVDPNHIRHLFITHVHTDHIGGSAYFKNKFGCNVYAPVKEADDLEVIDEAKLGLDVAKRAGFYPPEFEVLPCKVDTRVKDGDVFNLGRLQIKAIETPGHTRAHDCFLVVGTKRYFCCGDHISFGGLINLQNYPNSGSSLDGYRESAYKLVGLKVDGFFPGHGLFTINEGQKEIDLMIDAMDDLLVKGKFFVPNRFF